MSEERSISRVRRVHFATTKHAAICGLGGSDYTSSPYPRVVNCPGCLKVMGENYLRNMEAAGLVPPLPTTEEAKHRAHEAECESAAMALLNERSRSRARRSQEKLTPRQPSA